VAMLFQLRAGDPIPAIGDGETVVDYAGHASRYLTDGVNLYRFVGEIGQLIALEECWTMEVVLLTIGDLRAGRLRAVVPAGAA
jgi:hypothetical protein